MVEKTIQDLTQGAAAQVEAHIAQRLERMSLPDNLLDAIRYALLGGGKRVRPVLTLLSCEAVGGRRDDALSPAAALELIHAFSLVHDDLPAMDDDDMRRGRPTLHIHAGEAMAILAGDAMMSLAFQFVAEAGLDDARAAAVTSELALGTTRMIAGQVYDTLGGFPAKLTDRQRLDMIHRNKTGALIRAACRIGGICGGADDVSMMALTTYGESVGLMFQIVDDVLDVTQSAEHLGKATGKDENAGKLTYPGLIGVEPSRDEARRLCERAIEAIQPLGPASEPLAAMCRHMAVRTR
jgi:geranylgeranyl diphosphate synthase, type II